MRYFLLIGIGIAIWLLVVRFRMTKTHHYFVGIKSGFVHRREAWRNSSCGRLYKQAKIPYLFFIGVPIVKGHDLTAHSQGAHDTPEERALQKALEQEAYMHRDINLGNYRDQYMDLSLKTLRILQYGLSQTHADYIIVHDDEYCLNIDSLRKISHPQYLYAGYYLWQGTEYKIMTGPEGDVSPFFSGALSMLSRDLADIIINVDAFHTVMYGYYGTSSDDSNIGRWVKWAREQHNISVSMEVVPSMLMTVATMN